MHDPYDVLGIEAGAELSAVKRAYLRRKELYAQVEAAYQGIQDLLRRVEEEKQVVFSPVLLSGACPDPEHCTGAYLRWVREQAGLSIRQLADRTKISSPKLADIEAERFAYLPPTVYLRGFVREIARCLGLANALQISEFYLKRVPEGTNE